MAAKKKTASKTKRAAKPTKDETVEVASQSLLLGNMPQIRDLNYHMGQIAGYLDKARTASAKVTEAKKKAKEAGVEVAAVMKVLNLKRADPLAIAAEFRQLAALMQEAGLPVQIQLFEPKFGTALEQAAAEGRNAGLNGRAPPVDRWVEGTPENVAMTRAWNDAQAEIINNGKTKVPAPMFE